MQDEAELMALGVRRLHAGDVAGAEALCAEALGKNPRDSEALNLRAMIAQRRGDFAAAVELQGQAIAVRPDAPGYHNNLGVSLHALGRVNEAAEAYRRAATLNPGSAQIQFNLGNTLRELGALGPALAALREAIRLQPETPEFHYAMGLALMAGDQAEEAAGAYRAALQLKPDFADAWMHLGNMLQTLGRIDESLDANRRAVALRPQFAGGHNNLAMALYMAGDLEGSLREFQDATRLCPDFASAWSNLANVLRDLGRFEEAVAGYRRAISLQVDHVDARKNLALALLQMGDYANGFIEYEWRWKSDKTLVRKYNKPRWTGEGPHGQTVFVYEEQGFGDVIQFSRYAEVLAERGARVIFGCRPELGRLMAACAGVAHVVTAGQVIPAFDYHCALLSLPLFCGTTSPANVPAKAPYFRLAADVVAAWKARVKASGRLKVGLCWGGNPENRNDRLRRIPVKDFAPLASAGGTEFHSLQVGPAAMEWKEAAALALVDHAAEIRDFADTAALIEQLDLVISVDTSVAHLAGAMGKPVWILVPSASDWRWLLERSDSPWYPTARLFRQKGEGWEAVIEEMARELGRLSKA